MQSVLPPAAWCRTDATAWSCPPETPPPSPAQSVGSPPTRRCAPASVPREPKMSGRTPTMPGPGLRERTRESRSFQGGALVACLACPRLGLSISRPVAALLAALLIVLGCFTASASASSTKKILEACSEGRVPSGYSQQAYNQALRQMPPELSEYSPCPSLIHKAQLAAAGGHTGRDPAAARVARERPRRSLLPRRPSSMPWKTSPTTAPRR